MEIKISINLYKVYAVIFDYESFSQYNVKYFTNKELAISYKKKLENFRQRYISLVKKLKKHFEAKEKEFKELGFDENYIFSMYPKREKILYDNSTAFNFVNYKSEVKFEVLKISTTDTIIADTETY